MTSPRRIHKVLLVEDDPSIQALVGEALKPLDVVVVGVTDGRDALARFRDVQPDLVLLDIALPGVSGWDILAELRSIDDAAGVPVIIVTAHGQSDWEAAALRRGANLFVEKPFRIATLVGQVANLLGTSERPAGAGETG